MSMTPDSNTWVTLTVEQEERHEMWAYVSGLYPPYVSYQEKTSRHIPLVLLTTGRSIEVFAATS